MKNQPIEICGVKIQPGERLTLALPTPEIYTCAPLHIPMHIIHGKREGPKVLICATLYGDEANGIDIVHRLLEMKVLKNIYGTLICIPVMNVYGLINHTRLLPDNRDLSKSFPGSKTGSFSARLAYLFTSEIINLMTHCINIRSGFNHIYKLPQVYFHPEDDVATHLAYSFGAPLIRPSDEKTGFFYSDHQKPKCSTLIFEGGEAYRTDDYSVKIGIRGIIRVLKELKMIRLKEKLKETSFIKSNTTVRLYSPGSGIFQLKKRIGKKVEKGDELGVVTDPFGSSKKYDLNAPEHGMISSVTTYPHVFEGQNLIELALMEETRKKPVEIPPVEPNIIDY